MPLQVLVEIPRVILNKVGVAADPGVLITLLIRESKLLNGVYPLDPRLLVVSRGSVYPRGTGHPTLAQKSG